MRVQKSNILLKKWLRNFLGGKKKLCFIGNRFPSNDNIFSSCVTFNELVHTHTCEDLVLWFWHTRFSEGSDFNSNKDYSEVTKPHFHFIQILMSSHITSWTSTWFQPFSSDQDILKVGGHGQDS